jgi:hypothetical protein
MTDETCLYCWEPDRFRCANCASKICDVHSTKLNGKWYCDHRCWEQHRLKERNEGFM